MGYDVIMNFPSHFKDYFEPDKLHQINVNFVVKSMERQIGGTGTNIAYNLGLFKEKNVKLLSSVGKDGQVLIDYMTRSGINTEGIITDKRVFSATGTVITDTDDNQIWGFYYGACEAAKDIVLKDFADKKSLLIIGPNHPEAFLNFQKQAIQLKMDYVFDPGMTISWNTGEKLLEGVMNCKWLVGNDYEIAKITEMMGVTVAELVKKGIKVITTLGAEGVRYQDSDTEFYVPAYQNKKVVDPTGAGDAWRAGFMSGIVDNKSIEESLRLGNAVASYAVEMYGTANHTPTLEHIQQRADSLKKMAL